MKMNLRGGLRRVMLAVRVVGVTGLGLAGSAAASAQPSYTLLHSFAGVDGAYPNTGLEVGPGGALYGTTTSGGAAADDAGGGVAFSLTPAGKSWKTTVIHRFGRSRFDGATPHGRLLADWNGVLYGTTYGGGQWNQGTVYRLTPPPADQTAWQETVLYSFTGAGDGANPDSEVVQDRAGCLYGTTSISGPGYQGTVYRLCPPASGQSGVASQSGYATRRWTIATLHGFAGPDGAMPIGGLIARTVGNVFTLFGTTSAGGKAGQGTVFSLAAPQPGGTTWRHTVLHAFSGGSDGAAPIASLISDGDLNLYGTATQGGLFPGNTGAPGGVVFKLTPPAPGKTAWTELVLHSFAGGPDGLFPIGGVVESENGHLFGTSAGEGFGGCAFQCGTAYELAPIDFGGHIGPWYARILHGFSGPDGDAPSAPLTPRPASGDMSFYGITERGGADNFGTVFKVTP